MQTAAEVMEQLKSKGSEQTRRTLARHGAPDTMFGVKVADLKLIARQIKGNQRLALELFETGNSDAMYLAGIVADGAQMTRQQLDSWAKNASWHMISGNTVAWVATESPHARQLALKWIKSKQELIASSGWCTYSGIVAITPDEQLDRDEICGLLDQIVARIDAAPGRVRYVMNGFVISVGTYVKPLLSKAKATARKLGQVTVDMGETSCKVPLATDYIDKVESMGRVGKKRKTIRC